MQKKILYLLFFFFYLVEPVLSFQLISEAQEIDIGREVAKELEENYGIYNNPKEQERVNIIGEKIAAVCDRKNLPFSFKILNTNDINAFCCPGGFIYVTKGLLDLKISDNELACVLAHEITHAVKRHAMKQMESALGIQFILSALTQGASQRELAYQVMQILLSRGYSRENEFEADENGCWYAFMAFYDAHAMNDFLGRLQKMETNQISIAWLSTHPATSDRIERIKNYLVRVYGR